MWKLSVAVADTMALPDAFVVFRGIEASIRSAATLGYDGVELALKTAGEVNRGRLRQWLADARLEVSCISTGQVYAGLGLSLTDPDPDRRRQVRGVFRDLIDLAAEFGRMINIGRARGRIGPAPREEAEGRFVELAGELCRYAAGKDVTLVIEPVNRYELDFVNTVAEAAALARKVAEPNLKIMPDVFHMNIEDRSIAGEIVRHIDQVAYIHLADSNRLAPGWGHLDFAALLAELNAARYGGWLSVEILPRPDPLSAARQAADFLRPLIAQHGISQIDKTRQP
jgi:5-keto-L-gluconate epimerase